MIALYRNAGAIDRLFSDNWLTDPWTRSSSRRHKETFVNVKDGVASFTREVPGVPKEKIAIIWKDNILSVSGKTETRSIEFKSTFSSCSGNGTRACGS